MSIRIWNRKNKKEEEEKVYGDVFVKALYQNPLGLSLTDKILSRAWISKLYGAYQNTNFSKAKISKFIQDFSIPMDEYENKNFVSFNDFFIRKFKAGKRNFTEAPELMPAFAEARYSAYASVDETVSFPVKGKSLNALSLLGHAELAQKFSGGPGFIARLCPVDYHRFHFPDEGKVQSSYTLHGKLHSVNPIALQAKEDIFLKNERQISILETKNFGLLAYIEVGALCVGRIVQNYARDKNFHRGEEKGYFLFGGSTVILLGEKGKWIPDEDLLAHTKNCQESLVLLGTPIAKKL